MDMYVCVYHQSVIHNHVHTIPKAYHMVMSNHHLYIGALMCQNYTHNDRPHG